MVRKEQIINGLMAFIQNEVIRKSYDPVFKVVAEIAMESLTRNNELVDSFLCNPMVKSFMKRDDVTGMYDLDEAMTIIGEVLNKNGGIDVTVPSVPFLMPKGMKIHFNSDDINNLHSYIQRA